MSGLRLAVAGGGTGGHIVPGRHLLEGAGEGAIADLLWFTSGRAVEDAVLHGLEELVRPAPLERRVLALEPRGGGAPGLAGLLARTPRAARACRAALARHRSQVLLGLGGFTSLPPVLAARSLGLPVALLEVNAVRGRATRWLAPAAARVLHSWPASVPPGSPKHRCCGPPLPRALRDGPPRDRRAARAALGFAPERPLLCVLGGSQGAGPLNRFVREHDAALAATGVQVLHQVGPGRAGEAAAARRGYRAEEYVRDVPAALAAATAVLCRGGASTLAEVGASATPAWVVPYAHHADRHQAHNAEALGGGARIVPEERLAERVGDLVGLLGEDGRDGRERMARAAERAVPRDGARRILSELAALAGGGAPPA